MVGAAVRLKFSGLYAVSGSAIHRLFLMEVRGARPGQIPLILPLRVGQIS